MPMKVIFKASNVQTVRAHYIGRLQNILPAIRISKQEVDNIHVVFVRIPILLSVDVGISKLLHIESGIFRPSW